MGAHCLRGADEFPDEERRTGKLTFNVDAKSYSAAVPADPYSRSDSLADEREGRSVDNWGVRDSTSSARGKGLDQRILVVDPNGAWPLAPLARSVPRSRRPRAPQAPVPVTLHIYDIGTSGVGHGINKVLRPLGTGVFHCGVEVYGCEFSYSDTTSGIGDGVFCSRPRNCEGHTYCESVAMGETATSEEELARLIEMLKGDWPVHAYEVLAHNCCHFSDEFCQRLGVGSIPTWVMNLAGAGAAVASAGDTTCCRQVASQVALQVPCCPSVGVGKAHIVEIIDIARATPRQLERKVAN